MPVAARKFDYLPRRSPMWSVQIPSRFKSPCWKVEKPHKTEDEDDPLSEGRLFEARFRMLVERWRKESKHLSSTKSMAALDSYEQIIKMDKPVITLLLLELKERPNFWFTALRKVTGEKEIGKGLTFKEAVNAWIKWGYDNNYLHEGPS
jgi:hypothetical protein